MLIKIKWKFTFNVEGKTQTVTYMQHIFKELRRYFSTFFVIPLSALRSKYHKVLFVFFRNFVKEWLSTSTIYIEQRQLILRFPWFSFCWSGAKKIHLSSNIQTGNFLLNLVPKAFSLDSWNAIAKTPQSAPLPWRWADLVLMRSCFLLHRWSWHIWWAIFLVVDPLAKESLNFHSIFLLLSSYYYPVIVTVNNLDKFILVACEFF